MGRVFRITVCLRPFRAAGPRMEVEKVGEKVVVHNYGHGGSGWSLSWGAAAMAVERVRQTGVRRLGVIGCGAIGLTTALEAQRAGLEVKIYARERPPEVRSSWATGSWTPDSRIALESKAGPAFGEKWEKMARHSWRRFESYLGLADEPVEWVDRYTLSDEDIAGRRRREHREGELDFARYGARIADLQPGQRKLEAGENPFPVGHAWKGATLTFNIAAYQKLLLREFLEAGGKLETREFRAPGEFSVLPERTLVNCTGYGARALFRDESVVPVRGQINWLIPQPEARYAVIYGGVFLLSRRDGVVVQRIGASEMEGYGNAEEKVDRTEAEEAVGVMGRLFARRG
jgi:glycine/D-amino acid oxidase-like deaminating enzyme